MLPKEGGGPARDSQEQPGSNQEQPGSKEGATTSPPMLPASQYDQPASIISQAVLPASQYYQPTSKYSSCKPANAASIQLVLQASQYNELAESFKG